MEVERGPPPGLARWQPARARPWHPTLSVPPPPLPVDDRTGALSPPRRPPPSVGRVASFPHPPPPFSPPASSLPGLGRRLGAPLPPPFPLPPVFWPAWRRRRRRRGARRRRGSQGWAPALAAGRHEYLSDCWGHEPCGVHCNPAAQDEDVSQLCGYVNGLWLRARRGSVGGGWVGGAAWMDVASDWHWLLSRALFDAFDERLCWRCWGCRGCLARSQVVTPGTRSVLARHTGRGP